MIPACLPSSFSYHQPLQPWRGICATLSQRHCRSCWRRHERKSPPDRWGSLNFNKGATPSSPHLPTSCGPLIFISFASSGCSAVPNSKSPAQDAVDRAWTRTANRQRRLDQNSCQRECQTECEIECQWECQIDCQIECHIECENRCQVECQNECLERRQTDLDRIECQNRCQIEWHNICQIECQIACQMIDLMSEYMYATYRPDGMSEPMSEWFVRVGITQGQ